MPISGSMKRKTRRRVVREVRFQNEFTGRLTRDYHGAGGGFDKRFAMHGARISIVGRSAEKSAAVAAEICALGGDAVGFAASVRGADGR
jgi:hypothetical protein